MISYSIDSVNSVKGKCDGQMMTDMDMLGSTPYDCQDASNAKENELINIIGQSEAIKKTRFLISTHSRYDAPVLITGETGTGKELAARGLHYCGQRASKPFIPINCATLTDELFSSEIFGHVKGSFTDAKKDKKGLLALAEKGTLFLDEVDSLPLKSQAALLRFLQEGEYRPVGSETSYRSNVRLIASANCDLEERIQKGLFRADLYYRLFILSVHMPPLRERKSDIAILADHFVTQFHHQYGLGIKRFSPELLAVFQARQWHGNIRELENLVHRLYLCQMGNVIDTDMLSVTSSEFSEQNLSEPSPSHLFSPASLSPSSYSDTTVHSDERNIFEEQSTYSFSEDKKQAVEYFEKQYVEGLMAKTKGNVTLSAKLCGKERRAFGKLVKKYNVQYIE